MGPELHVVSIAEAPDYAERFFERKREDIEDAARRFGVEHGREVIRGHPAKEPVEYAGGGGFDLMVVGREGHGAFERFMVGSVSRRLAIHSPCPVLIVPKKE